MKIGIAEKVNLLFIFIIIAFGFIVGWYFVQHEKRILNNELNERINALLSNLSLNVEYPVLIRNYDEISKLVKGILAQKDIIFCQIESKDGTLLFQDGSKRKEYIQEYTHSILAEKRLDTEDNEALILGVDEKVKEEIGRINLAISLTSRNQRMDEVKRFALIAGITASIFVFFLSSLLLKVILGKPVAGLLKGIKNIAAGDLSYKVPVKTKDEIGLLATSFNKMSEDLSKIIVSKDYVDNIIESMLDTLIIISPEGAIGRVNQATLDLLDYKEEELIGKDISLLFQEEEMLFKENKLEKLIEEGHLKNYEINYKAKGGRKIPMLFSCALMKNKEGNIINIVCVAKDITKRKVIEKQLEDFAYIVSHDLKAPLRAVNQLAIWISEDYADAFDEEGIDQMNLLVRRVKRMDNLINGILLYSRVGRIKGKEEKVNLNILVKEVIENLAPMENIQVTIENNLPVISADRIRIEQVFQNLISNAVKFMDKPKGEIKIGCVDENTHWKFSVADNGPGIDAKYYDKIFQIFQTLESCDTRESTGVGLSVAKKIVELYDGKIWVESKIGEGSTFFFTLKKTGVPTFYP